MHRSQTATPEGEDPAYRRPKNPDPFRGPRRRRKKPRATRHAAVSSALVIADIGVELGVSLVYLLAYLQGMEPLLVLAVLHLAGCVVCGLTHAALEGYEEEQENEGGPPPPHAHGQRRPAVDGREPGVARGAEPPGG
jgi:hypothetical protein